MHPNIFQIAGCLSDNIIPVIIIMIPIGFKEGPTCLKADIFQVTSFDLIKILTFPTNFSFVLYMSTRYSNPWEI